MGLVEAPPGPASPEAFPPQAAGLIAVVLVAALAWLVGRPIVLRALQGDGGNPGDAAAACAVLLVLCVVAALIWVGNPYAAALLVPALHLWLFSLLPELRPRRGIGLLFVAAGLVPFAILLAVLGAAFGLGLIDTAWFGLLVVAGGHASPLSWVLWSIVASCVAGAVDDRVARPRAGRASGRPGSDHGARAGDLRGPRLARRRRIELAEVAGCDV